MSLVAALLIIASRPLIDLTGRYEGTGINLGGIAGLVFVGFLVGFASLSHRHLSFSILPALLTAGGILLVGFLAWAIEDDAPIAPMARAVVGLSPLLLLFGTPRLAAAHYSQLFILTVRILLATSSIPVVVAWAQWMGWVPFTYFDYYDGAPVGRPSGGYFQPNSLGRLLVFHTLLVVMMLWSRNLRLRAAIPLVVLAAATTFITTHRTSIVSFVAVVGILSLGLLARRRRVRLRSVGLAAVSTVACIVFVIALSSMPSASGFRDDVLRTTNTTLAALQTLTEAAPTDDVFLRGRGRIWRASLESFAEQDAITRWIGLGYEPLEAHNDALRILLMHGILGVVAYAALFVGLFVWGVRRTELRGRLALTALFAYLVLYSIPLHPTAYPFFMWLFFLTFAMAVALFPSSELIERAEGRARTGVQAS